MRANHSAVRFAFLCLVLAALACGLTACSRSSGTDEEGGASSSEGMVAEVTLTRVARIDISQTITITGTLAALPNRDVKVSALVAGRIATLSVAEGDQVKEGEILAQIDDRPYRDQLQQAEAAVEQEQAGLENAKLTLTRNEDLFKRGIVARKDLEDARAQQRSATAALSKAEAALALARLELTRTEVRSPLSGLVVKRFAGVGEQVDGTAAQPIAEVANLDEVELFASVPAAYLSKFRVGQTFPMAGEAVPERLEGRVVRISPAVDPSTDVGLVRIRMRNPGGLRLGMFLTVMVPLETHSGVLGVPPQAIYRDAQGHPQIYRVEGDQATAVPVELGLETKDQVELLSGAREGETVILTGGYGLGAKAKVEVRR